jgi:hypothetical protein
VREDVVNSSSRSVVSFKQFHLRDSIDAEKKLRPHPMNECWQAIEFGRIDRDRLP